MPLNLTLKDLYLKSLLAVYALYAFFNKGVAYSFLAEAVLLTGMILIVFNLRRFVFFKSRPVTMIMLFMIAAGISLVFQIRNYPLYPLLQDASMFFYGLFTFVVFYLQDKLDVLKRGLFKIYAVYPVVAFLSFLCLSYIPNAGDFILFGNVPLLLYKYGDMAVHLLISTLLLLCGHIKPDKKFQVVYVLLIVYLFLVIAAYNRAGMLAYMAGLTTFLLVYRKRFSVAAIKSYIRFAPLLFGVVILAYANTKVEENFQGRKVGLEQLQQNIVSIFSTDVEGSLSDNKVWRLAWWLQIITDAVQQQYLLTGKGLGVNLAIIGDIKVEDENLRSPHNFHLNILARFGFPIFFLWIYWMIIHFRRISTVNNEFSVIILIMIMAFLINASFDVYLEGPMGAMPFWTWLGVLYVQDAKS